MGRLYWASDSTGAEKGEIPTPPSSQEEPAESQGQEEDNHESVGSTDPEDLSASVVPKGHKQNNIKNYHQAWSFHDALYTDTSCEVAILFSPSLQLEVLLATEAVPGHLLHLCIWVQGFVLNLVNSYDPVHKSEMAHFYWQATTYRRTLSPHKCLILWGTGVWI